MKINGVFKSTTLYIDESNGKKQSRISQKKELKFEVTICGTME